MKQTDLFLTFSAALGLILAGCAQMPGPVSKSAPPEADGTGGALPKKKAIDAEGESEKYGVPAPFSGRKTRGGSGGGAPGRAKEEMAEADDFPASEPIEMPEAPVAEGFIVKRVLYGTNRRRSGELSPNEFFGAERGGLQTGFCFVSIPEGHETGALETPSLLRIEFQEDPKKHVVLMQVEPTSRRGFAQLLQEEVAAGPRKRAFVFIHGYNVKFKDAARRTAQLAYDLRFKGAPIFFSWPSRGEMSLYLEDRNDNEWSRPHLRKFLTTVVSESDAEEVYIIAHSMGNLLTSTVMADVCRQLGSANRTKIKAVILAAPDIDADTFKTDIAPELAETGVPITVYTSKRDKALLASEKVWKYQRVGQNAAALAGLPGIEAIDSSAAVTDYLNHGYFGDHTRLLRDLNLVFDGVAPGEGSRSYLQEQEIGEGKHYWLLAP